MLFVCGTKFSAKGRDKRKRLSLSVRLAMNRSLPVGNSIHSFTQPSANGPTAKSYKKADMRSWKDMEDFFNEVFRKAASTQPTTQPADGSAPWPE